MYKRQVLHLTQVKVAPLEVINHASRCGDEDVEPRPKRGLLGSVGSATVEHLGAEPEATAEGGELLINLRL